MNCVVVIDWDDSPDFQDNNASALGRPLAAYPLMAAKSAARVHRRFVMTASQPSKSAALQYGAIILDPPASSAEKTSGAFLRHAALAVTREIAKEGARLELLIALSAQAPAVTGEIIDTGVNAVLEKSGFDSALSVSNLPRLSSYAALRENPDGAFGPCVELRPHDGATLNPEIWYPNWSLMVLKPELLNAKDARPFGWLGEKSFAIKQAGVWPADYQWQIPALEAWLKKHGASDAAYAPEPRPQAQKSAKPSQSRPIL